MRASPMQSLPARQSAGQRRQPLAGDFRNRNAPARPRRSRAPPVHDLLEIDVRAGLKARIRALAKGECGRRAVLGLLAELRGGNERRPAARRSMRVKESFLPLRPGQTSPMGLSRQASRMRNFCRAGSTACSSCSTGTPWVIAPVSQFTLASMGGDDVAFFGGNAVAREIDRAQGPRPQRAP